MDNKRSHRFIDRTGERIGFLTITSLSDEKYINPNTSKKTIKWNYKCDCGNIGSGMYTNIYKSGKKKFKQSCGCNSQGMRETKLLYEQGLKKCSACNEILPLNKFSKNKNTLVGYQSMCKKCKSICDKNYRENPAQGRKSLLNKKIEYHIKIKLTQPEKYNLMAEKRKENRDYSKEYQRIISDEMLKAKDSIRKCIISSLKVRNLTKSKLVLTSEDILGCKLEFFKEYIDSQFEEGMSWSNHGKWHLDHKVPLDLHQTTDELVKLNHYTNFQPLWAYDNLIKSNKMLIEHKDLHFKLLGRHYK